jgi:hypothetical protein
MLGLDDTEIAALYSEGVLLMGPAETTGGV